MGGVAAATALGEPFGVRQILALALTLGGVSLAIRLRSDPNPRSGADLVGLQVGQITRQIDTDA